MMDLYLKKRQNLLVIRWGEENVLEREEVDFLDNDIVFDQELAVILVGIAAVIVPPGHDGVDMERAEDELLNGVRHGHIILDRVKPTKNEAEYGSACVIESLRAPIFNTNVKDWCDKARVLGNISLPFSAYGKCTWWWGFVWQYATFVNTINVH